MGFSWNKMADLKTLYQDTFDRATIGEENGWQSMLDFAHDQCIKGGRLTESLFFSVDTDA